MGSRLHPPKFQLRGRSVSLDRDHKFYAAVDMHYNATETVAQVNPP